MPQDANTKKDSSIADTIIPSISNSFCFDFVRFRMSLARSRATHDDKIIQLVNSRIHTHSDCTPFITYIESIHKQRHVDLQFCIDELESKIKNKEQNHVDLGEVTLLKKELGLLKSELMVEQIVKARSLEVINNRCAELLL